MITLLTILIALIAILLMAAVLIQNPLEVRSHGCPLPREAVDRGVRPPPVVLSHGLVAVHQFRGFVHL
ncbi:MAG TPA: hypothetical protein P5563_01605, partial [Saprospiraceae bacterium]|nr:hypothetical protein [Saprospiraceae bacterium]